MSDISGWPERQLNLSYTLQTESGDALPILKKAFLLMTPGRHSLKILVLVLSNTDVLEQGILRACT
jgi:hypothetical protein